MIEAAIKTIKIETLTPVHIGSGELLHKWFDFIIDDKNEYLFVIDVDKMATIVGDDQLSIQKWADAISSTNIERYVKEILKGHQYDEVAKRRITNYDDFTKGQGTLKECLHDGLGRPYIPGSSIKGAIRTAIVATLAQTKSMEWLAFDRKGKIDLKAEEKLMGRGPQEDKLRFLHTGDAFFDKEATITAKQVNLNIRASQDKLLDYSKSQIVEAIGEQESSTFRLEISYDLCNQIDIRDISGLFDLLNNHTCNLLDDELHFWTDGTGGYYKGSDDYLYNIQSIRETISKCKTNECVLRLGQASGWRFITGAWTERLDDFERQIAPLSRPGNNQKYRDYPFPKSRRVDDQSGLFGFIKMTIL